MRLVRWIGFGLLAALTLMTMAGYAAWHAEPARRASERLFLGASPLPRRGGDGSFGLRDYEPTFSDHVRDGISLWKQHDYAWAAKRWSAAVRAWPFARRSGRPKNRAKRSLLQVVQRVAALLPLHHMPVQICRFPVPTAPEQWLVLSARMEGESVYGPFGQPRLYLFRAENDDYQPVWRSDVLQGIYTTGCPPETLALHVSDLTGDSVLEAVVIEGNVAASDAPEHLDLFTWQSDGLVKTFGIESHNPIWIEDLNRDRHYEIGACECIGGTISHAEQPSWIDIYTCTNGGSTLANRSFPDEFRGLERQIRTLLWEHPDDDELRQHLEKAREIRRPRAASTLRRRPEPLSRSAAGSRASGGHVRAG